jgi:hypothetical protein
MKRDTYYLFESGSRIAYSKVFEKVLNKTINTKNGVIYFNNHMIWIQNTNKYYEGVKE